MVVAISFHHERIEAVLSRSCNESPETILTTGPSLRSCGTVSFRLSYERKPLESL